MTVNQNPLADQLGHGRQIAFPAEDLVVVTNVHLLGNEWDVWVRQKIDGLDEVS